MVKLVDFAETRPAIPWWVYVIGGVLATGNRYSCYSYFFRNRRKAEEEEEEIIIEEQQEVLECRGY